MTPMVSASAVVGLGANAIGKLNAASVGSAAEQAAGAGLTLNGAFLQLTLQCPAMHTERASRRGNIAVVFMKHFLNMLPRDSINGRRVISKLYIGVAFLVFKGCDNVVSVGWFAQVVDGSELHGLHGRGNAGVTGKYHNTTAWHGG